MVGQKQLNAGLSSAQQSMQQQIFGRNPELAGLMGGTGSASQMASAPAMQAGNIPTMPAVQAEQPWTGSLANRNPFGGNYGGNLGFGSGQRQFGRGAGSFTPYGAGIVQVAGNGWAGSDAAAGYGLGAQGAGGSSGGAIALSDAIALHKKFAR